jgi:hypothetical protein
LRKGEPHENRTNDERAARAQVVLEAFDATTGDLEAAPATVLLDLLCDLQHWADTKKINWSEALRWAEVHHLAEIDDAGPR